MNRRSFLAALFAAPFIPVAAKAEKPVAVPAIYKDGVFVLDGARIARVELIKFDLSNAHLAPLSVTRSIIQR